MALNVCFHFFTQQEMFKAIPHRKATAIFPNVV